MFEPEEALGRRPQLCEPGGGNLGRRLKVAPTRHEENRTVKPRHIAIIKPGQTGQKLDQRRADARTCRMIGRGVFGRQRSEEHTSELQSLMRSSSAVFCLKKKNT